MAKRALATTARHSLFIAIAFVLVMIGFSFYDRSADIYQGFQQTITDEYKAK